jgi:ribonuclease P/MRP protein subunit RPP1
MSAECDGCGSRSRGPSVTCVLRPKMFFDLNVPVHHPQTSQNLSKKAKGKQPQQQTDVTWSPAQIGAIEARIDLLVHCQFQFCLSFYLCLTRRVVGYTVIALNQTVQTVVVPKAHTNILESLVAQLKPRPGIIMLKRLTIVLDQESEKGFGLVRRLYLLVALA